MNRLSMERAAFGVLVLAALASAITTPLGAVADVPKDVLQVAPTPKPFKIKCYGDATEEVTIFNVGSGPVPAGTVMHFEIPKGTIDVEGTFSTSGPKPLPGYSGSYVFQQPLGAGDQVMFSVAPSPQPGAAAGSPPPWVASVGALNIIATIRPCTFTIAPGTNAPPIHLEPGTIVPSP